MSAAKVINQYDFSKLKGQVFGALTVIAEAEWHIFPSGQRERKVNVECKCGEKYDAFLSHLRKGSMLSCGCLAKEKAKERMSTHGMTKTNEFNIWQSMKQRCYDKKNHAYKDYGGRGIFVCEEWINDFMQFYKDMGERPGKKYSLDRINNNLGYSKDNCRWATWNEQGSNRRRNNKNIGVCFNNRIKKYAAQLKVNGVKVLAKSFKTEEEAIKARKEAEIKYLGFNI